MNLLDANAVPMDVFTSTPDMHPFTAELPNVALDNLYPPEKPDAAMAYYMRLSGRQDLRHADQADPAALNEIIWYSVIRNRQMRAVARLPAFELMKAGIREQAKETEKETAAEE
jgi:hypothetical protein